MRLSFLRQKGETDMLHRQTYLNTYEECKYNFYKTAVLGEVPVSAEARDLGSVVHEAIRRILADGETMIAAAISYAIQKLKDEEVVPTISKDSMTTASWMIKKALKIAENFSPDSLIEEYIEFENIEENDIFSPGFHSQIDVYDKNTETIYDWKTGRLKANKRQLYIYAYMLKRKYGYIAKKGVFIYLRSGEIDEFEIKPQDIEDAERWVKETIKEIESKLDNLLFDNSVEETFYPTPNTRCKSCQFTLECSKVLSTNQALQSEREKYISSPDDILDSEPTTPEPDSEKTPKNTSSEKLDIEQVIKQMDLEEEPEAAKLLAAEIIRQEATLKAMKEALKGFVEKNGSVQVDEKEFNFFESVNWSFNTDNKRSMAANILMEGLDPWQYFDLSSTARKKLQRDRSLTDTDMESFLSKFGTLKTSRRFDCKTIKEPTPASEEDA